MIIMFSAYLSLSLSALMIIMFSLCRSLSLLFSKRLTSTGEDEREYQSDHETSWDEFDDRYDNFTAGRERLQEFSGRIPPRKKKTSNPGNTNNTHLCGGGDNANENGYSPQRERTTKEKVSNGIPLRILDSDYTN